MENTRTDKGTEVVSLVRFSRGTRYIDAQCTVATIDSVQQLAVIFRVRTVHAIVLYELLLNNKIARATT